MDNKDSGIQDILGIKPIGKAINTCTKAAVDGASAFLSRICLPVAEEFGLLLQDKVRGWRTKNLINIIDKARQLHDDLGLRNVHAHPRIVSLIVEHGSWVEEENIQLMWAGLLASSCTADGKDDSNLIFINLLSQMTYLQACLLNYFCKKADKQVDKNGLIYSRELLINVDELQEITGTSDVQRLDRELDHLRSLQLILEGFMIDTSSLVARATPTALALHLYARCNGSLKSPADFFGLKGPQ